MVNKRNLQPGANKQSWAQTSPAPALRPDRADLSVLYSRLNERDALLCWYLREGLLHGHRCIAYLDSFARKTVLDQLRAGTECDINADAMRLSGQLLVRDVTEQPNSVSKLWAEVVERDASLEFPCTRVIVETKNCDPGWVEPRRFLQFESELLSLACGDPVTFMFMYDLRGLDGALVVELVRAHYMIWAGEVPIANPYYTAV